MQVAAGWIIKDVVAKLESLGSESYPLQVFHTLELKDKNLFFLGMEEGQLHTTLYSEL